MSANLAKNVKAFLNKLSVRKIYALPKSAIGQKIMRNTNDLLVIGCLDQSKNFIERKYVLMKKNPADLESRGYEICKLERPNWLQDQI